MPISVFATITPKPEYFVEAVAAVEGIVADTRAEEGCIRFELHKGAKSQQLHLYEIWADQDAFDAHHAQLDTRAVYKQYESWLAAPVELTFMQPVA